jgi:hypothetical protein
MVVDERASDAALLRPALLVHVPASPHKLRIALKPEPLSRSAVDRILKLICFKANDVDANGRGRNVATRRGIPHVAVEMGFRSRRKARPR